MTEPDPTAIQCVVVTAADLVVALESNHRSAGEQTVLRITPPYSGRMRARLHVADSESQPRTATVTLPPDSLVSDDCPSPPDPDDVGDALRDDPTESYTVDRHRERYSDALDEWRSTVSDYVVDATDPSGTGEECTISLLGTIGDG